eukprot:TRINITY_DN6056_c0_g1_i2.p1 TRINITY_DN6056_c0_g1~~TRINITY_DN6056_c0_g1_i2.p1  ORF type:complete len:397 (+),score=90.97 TRINITY_DN6056_c0_g1_i2:2-1192(+)
MAWLNLFALALLAAASADQVIPKLHVVGDDITAKHQAACLDGSNPGYYFAPANSSAMNQTWVLYFKGGGWCYDTPNCALRAKEELGTTTGIADTFQFPEGPYSDDPTLNPDLAGANRVMLWYCDGASFTGSMAGPVRYNTTTLHFRGKHNMDAIIEELLTSRGLAQATSVLVSGGSAGGLAAFLHGDYIKTLLPDSVTRFKVAPGSGFFMLHDDAAGIAKYPARMENVFRMQNATSGLMSKCLSQEATGWHCIFAPVAWKYIESPIFPLQSLLDSWQMANVYPIDWQPCTTNHFAHCNATEVRGLNEFAQAMAKIATDASTYTKAGNGGFWHTCLMHVGEQGEGWTSYKLNGLTMQQAFSKWWNSPETDPASKHTHMANNFLSNTPPIQPNPSCFN